jgi:hypothetical protein
MDLGFVEPRSYVSIRGVRAALSTGADDVIQSTFQALDPDALSAM